MVHSDLKPANFLVVRGVLKLSSERQCLFVDKIYDCITLYDIYFGSKYLHTVLFSFEIIITASEHQCGRFSRNIA